MESCRFACETYLRAMGKKTDVSQSCMDCSAICSFLLKTKINHPENYRKLLKLCIQCCKLCIEECKKHPKIKECQKCIEECSKCIQDIYKNHSDKL